MLRGASAVARASPERNARKFKNCRDRTHTCIPPLNKRPLDGLSYPAKNGQMGGTCTRFPGFTGRCSADGATHLRKWSGWQDFHLRSLGPKPSALKTTLHPEENLGAGVGVAPTANWLMRPVGSLDLPAEKQRSGRRVPASRIKVSAPPLAGARGYISLVTPPLNHAEIFSRGSGHSMPEDFSGHRPQ